MKVAVLGTNGPSMGLLSPRYSPIQAQHPLQYDGRSAVALRHLAHWVFLRGQREPTPCRGVFEMSQTHCHAGSVTYCRFNVGRKSDSGQYMRP